MSGRKSSPNSGTKSLVVSKTLHKQLKARAQRDGRILQAMVEEKLKELVQPEQLELAAAGGTGE